MILRRVHPSGGDGALELDTDGPGARDRLLEWYSPGAGESIRLNFVTTLDGRATGEDGTSGSLTAGADRMILGVIREHADVILVGASTVRAESYRLPRATPLAIVTTSGDLGGHGFEPREGAPELLVLAPESASDAVRRSLRGIPHTILPLPDRGEPATAPELLGALRAHGAERIVCEGGPGLAGLLLAEGLVDEVCLTTVPRLGGSGIRLLADDDRVISRWAPRQLILDDEGVQYERWMRRAD